LAVDVDAWRAQFEGAAHAKHGFADSVAVHSKSWHEAEEVRRNGGPLSRDILGGEIAADAAASEIYLSFEPAVSGLGGTISQVLAEALQHFQTAEADLRAGNLAGYQTEINAAQALIAQANQLSGGATPSPSPSPSPSG